jgi:hypothetical protein
MQWGVGYVIDLFPSERADQYDPHGYQIAFALLLSIQVITMIWYFISSKQSAPTEATNQVTSST